MPVSVIHVQYKSGTPARGVKVALGFNSFCGGMTRSVCTNRYGKAVIAHGSSGSATVYVQGRARHQFHAPGFTAVTI